MVTLYVASFRLSEWLPPYGHPDTGQTEEERQVKRDTALEQFGSLTLSSGQVPQTLLYLELKEMVASHSRKGGQPSGPSL